MSNKIVIIGNNSGGMYSFRKELIQELVERGSRVIILTPFDDKIEELRQLKVTLINTPIDRRGINPVTDFKLVMRYYELLKKLRPNLVITYTIKPNIYASFVCRILKISFVANITGLGTAFQKTGLIQTLVTIMYKLTISKAKVVFFENIENRSVLLKKRIVTKSNTYVLSGAGVNLEYYPLTEYPEQEYVIKFLFIGRVMQEKGINELFTVLQRLHQDGINCSLDILGGLEENYQEAIEKYEKMGWLHYHGFQSDVRPYIAKAHCFVLPSWHEGMANTNLECAAMGRPVITSNIHGCKEAVIDGISGYLCEKKMSDSLYEKMKAFVELDYEDKVRMGRAGRKHMEKVFDKKKVVEETISVIEQFIIKV